MDFFAERCKFDADKFDKNFEDLTGHLPFPWQGRLFECLRHGNYPSALDLPTGLGKTAVMAIWYLARKVNDSLPRRLVYAVDRRAVVDQATTEAENIKENSSDKTLCISTLRGQYVDNRRWLADPSATAIIVGTVDMIGSRLLFEGYGVSRNMRPYHAGLLGTDTLLVLDESHLVPPFQRLLAQIAEKTQCDELGAQASEDRQKIPRFHLLPLSATGGYGDKAKGAQHSQGPDEKSGDGSIFQLDEEDKANPVVRKRLEAPKYMCFKSLDDSEKLPGRLAEEAWKLSENGARVLVYCDKRDDAEETKNAIEKNAADIPTQNIQLFVGARRVKERQDAKDALEKLGFFSAGSKRGDSKAAFVVATSAAEVGVDLDADHLVMDAVPFERMVQRLGRVNRLGREGHQAHIVVVEAVEAKDKKKDKKDEDLKKRVKCTLELLKKLPRLQENRDIHTNPDSALAPGREERETSPDVRDAYDASPAALMRLQKEHAAETRDASTPEPLYPALTRALVEAWSMTSLKEHTGRPAVAPWCRGWVSSDLPQTTLIWRQHLPVRTSGDKLSKEEIKEIDAFFAAATPHLAEKLETESFRVVNWLKERLESVKNKENRASEEDEEDIVAFILGEKNELKEKFSYTLRELKEAFGNKKQKEEIEKPITGNTLVLDARLGGLTGGLLDGHSEEPVSAADKDGWPDGQENEKNGVPLVPFRVQRVSDDDNEGSPDADWHRVHSFNMAFDDEGQATKRLVIDIYRGESAGGDEDARSIAHREQSLSEHQACAALKAQTLVDNLMLKDELARAIVIAARLHDEGKQARRWQDAFSVPRDKRPLAKTAGKKRVNQALLAGYRHEFGSLFYLDKDPGFKALSGEMQDLVRHLIAAHHGRARPVIPTKSCDAGPPSQLEEKARDVALRFARLQRRYGPWGLAWLEAILRAADQQASRDLEHADVAEGYVSNG